MAKMIETEEMESENRNQQQAEQPEKAAASGPAQEDDGDSTPAEETELVRGESHSDTSPFNEEIVRNLPEIDLSDIDIDEHVLSRYSTRTIKRLGRKKFARFKLKDEYVENIKQLGIATNSAANKCQVCSSFEHLTDTCPQLLELKNFTLDFEPRTQSDLDEISQIIFFVTDKDKITQERQNKIAKFVKNIEEKLNDKLDRSERSIRLDVFGSNGNGFGTNNADVDICFRFGEEEPPEGKECAVVIKNISGTLRRLKMFENEKVIYITSAKVPIVKFECKGIEGDISYYNTLALYNTRMLKRYCEWAPEILPALGMFAKKWAKFVDIGDPVRGTLSSYAFIVLTIHYLQRTSPPVLPILQEEFDDGQVEHSWAEGWDVYFHDEIVPNWSMNTQTLAEHFLGFLAYYTKFDWDTQVVQIRRSAPLEKKEKDWNRSMCIEDPFDREHNLASRINKKMFVFLMKTLQRSCTVFMTPSIRQKMQKRFDQTDIENQEKRQELFTEYLDELLKESKMGDAPCERTCNYCKQLGHFFESCEKRIEDRRKRDAEYWDKRDQQKGRSRRDSRSTVDAEDNLYRPSGSSDTGTSNQTNGWRAKNRSRGGNREYRRHYNNSLSENSRGRGGFKNVLEVPTSFDEMSNLSESLERLNLNGVLSAQPQPNNAYGRPPEALRHLLPSQEELAKMQNGNERMQGVLFVKPSEMGVRGRNQKGNGSKLQRKKKNKKRTNWKGVRNGNSEDAEGDRQSEDEDELFELEAKSDGTNCLRDDYEEMERQETIQRNYSNDNNDDWDNYQPLPAPISTTFNRTRGGNNGNKRERYRNRSQREWTRSVGSDNLSSGASFLEQQPLTRKEQALLRNIGASRSRYDEKGNPANNLSNPQSHEQEGNWPANGNDNEQSSNGNGNRRGRGKGRRTNGATRRGNKEKQKQVEQESSAQ
ncbi:hypothetical protein WR25_23579 [Diploscapter pachys]|uniref:Uncharacterized protein n=1 Tax=Diploscapter pachys TaxID=2018661 RepID=A0A2A2L2N3_9BILA|nr:hypothetical protein WR25_23579 [Diploscapter pachys]